MSEEQQALFDELQHKHPDYTEDMIMEMVWSRTMPEEAAEVHNG